VSATKTRKRKPVSAARIELHLWFADLDAYNRFAAVLFARKSQSVNDREWVASWWGDLNDGAVEATYRFTHTCRNDGAQRGDSEKFFRATCNAAGVRHEGPTEEAVLIDVTLLSRETVEP
jgi:hypothetical protein